jgi:long-chain fatty acid transport protein
MKNMIKLALPTFLILSSSALYATNGDLMIGQGAKSRAMGGVGVAKGFGADSGLANPALVTSVRHSEFTGALTFFMPNVEFDSNDMDPDTSGNNFSAIPEFAYARSVGAFGIGIQASGVAGMGVDYDGLTGTTNDNGAFDMQTNLQLFKVALPVALEVYPSVSIGVAPVLEIGSLQMNYMTPTGESDNPSSSSSALGYEVGAAYDDGTYAIGVVYKSEIELSYADNIANAAADFNLPIVSNNLTQPAEYGIGLSYRYHRNILAADYRLVSWSDAQGYADFGWKDQDIFAIGYQYKFEKATLRLGFNYAESPIVEQDGSSREGAAKNFFNLAGFPAIVEQHYTAGFGYNFNQALELNGAFVYAPQVKKSYDISAMSGAMGYPTPASADVKHSQFGLTFGLSYKFLSYDFL